MNSTRASLGIIVSVGVNTVPMQLRDQSFFYCRRGHFFEWWGGLDTCGRVSLVWGVSRRSALITLPATINFSCRVFRCTSTTENVELNVPLHHLAFAYDVLGVPRVGFTKMQINQLNGLAGTFSDDSSLRSQRTATAASGTVDVVGLYGQSPRYGGVK